MGSQVKKSLTYKVIGKEGGVLFLVCVKGENQVFTHHHCHKVFIELSLQRNSEI